MHIIESKEYWIPTWATVEIEYPNEEHLNSQEDIKAVQDFVESIHEEASKANCNAHFDYPQDDEGEFRISNDITGYVGDHCIRCIVHFSIV